MYFYQKYFITNNTFYRVVKNRSNVSVILQQDLSKSTLLFCGEYLLIKFLHDQDGITLGRVPYHRKQPTPKTSLGCRRHKF